MPNHVINKIVNCSDFSKLEKYISKEDNTEFLDFDKIIPMPKELDIQSGSDGELGRAYLLKEGTDYISKEEVIKRIEERTKEERNEILRLGQAYIDNKSKYGFPTWYEWRNYNWGTKWNSYDNKIKRNKEGKILFIEFQTAWAVPEPILEKLAKECDFTILYADEDIGSNCGIGKANNGSFSFTDAGCKIFARMVWNCKNTPESISKLIDMCEFGCR